MIFFLCFSEDNWEEKLHELFNDNFEDDENPLGESYFLHLSPRSKIEVLLKLCELRLDVEGALDEIKVIMIYLSSNLMSIIYII